MTNLALPELDVRSVLDVVEDNFQNVGLKTYPLRMIYTGEHFLPKEEFIKEVRKCVDNCNTGYCEINVTGILLVYESYFVHIVEGSEDTVHRQIRFMLKNEGVWIERKQKQDEEDELALIEEAMEAAKEAGVPYVPLELPPRPVRKMFRKLKMLMVFQSINSPMFESWRAVCARPLSLVGKLDIYGPLEAHMEQLKICLNKISHLCEYANSGETLSFDGLSAMDPKMEALPEVALLDFLLQSKYLLELRNVVNLHRRVDDYSFYFESVWPLPTHFTPRYLYKLKIDDTFVEPLPVMPWELKSENPEEEEGVDREDRSGSSSSD